MRKTDTIEAVRELRRTENLLVDLIITRLRLAIATERNRQTKNAIATEKVRRRLHQLGKGVSLPAPAAPTKKSLILALLRRPQGAELGELMAATGWQAHSIRGFLSKMGPQIVRRKRAGMTIYSIPVRSA